MELVSHEPGEATRDGRTREAGMYNTAAAAEKKHQGPAKEKRRTGEAEAEARASAVTRERRDE